MPREGNQGRHAARSMPQDTLLSSQSEREGENRMSEKGLSQPRGPEIKVKLPDEILGGVYANTVVVTHTQEEFIMDFMVVAPPTGKVTARVIMSPAHTKRVVAALQANVKKYEDRFGNLRAAPEPPKEKLGFHTEE